MLTIREEQLRVLRTAMIDRFYTDMQRHLEQRFHGRISGMGNADLRDMIISGVQFCAEHGIRDVNDVRRFLEYLAQYGRDFGQSHDTGWAATILNEKHLSGTDKMDEIDAHDLFVITLGHNNAEL